MQEKSALTYWRELNRKSKLVSIIKGKWYNSRVIVIVTKKQMLSRNRFAYEVTTDASMQITILIKKKHASHISHGLQRITYILKYIFQCYTLKYIVFK